MRKRILIAGAGVSGLTAAIKLALANFDVTIYEKRNEVVESATHTSVIRNYSIPNMDAIEEFKRIGVNINPESRIHKVIKVSPNYYSHVEGDTIYYTFGRGNIPNSLEKQLFSKAIKSGVNFKFGVTNIKNVDIVATGYKNEPNIKAYGENYLNANVEDETVYLFYNDEFAPKGYLCVIPSKRDCTTILSVTFDTSIDFNQLQRIYTRAIEKNKLLKFLLIGADSIQTVIGGGYYNIDPISDCEKNGVLYVGEAGGFQDASRGFGIRYAILTGALAAESIIKGKDYRKMLKDYFKEEFNENYKRRIIFNHFNNENYDEMIKELGKTTTLNEYIFHRKKYHTTYFPIHSKF